MNLLTVAISVLSIAISLTVIAMNVATARRIKRLEEDL